MKRGSRYVHVVCVPQRVVQHVPLTQLSGGAVSVSGCRRHHDAGCVHQGVPGPGWVSPERQPEGEEISSGRSRWVDPRGADVQQVNNRLTTG